MENEADIIIIGAGICGLSLAETLSRNKKKVIILEARDRTGGRINTLKRNFSKLTEAGAEFIHGKLPFTLELIEKAGSSYFEKKGEFYKSANGEIYRDDAIFPYRDEFMKELKSLKEDMTLSEFINSYFKDPKYNELTSSLYKLAEGFDAADTSRISAKSMQEELKKNSFELAYLPENGYGSIINYLSSQCNDHGVKIYLSKVAKLIEWSREKVNVNCSDQSVYGSRQLVVTVPLGVLMADEQHVASLQFDPSLSGQLSAAMEMGFGPVIKVILEFKNRFWNNANYGNYVKQIPDLGFLMNESVFPMFWAGDGNVPMITGWVGGTAAEKIKMFSEDKLKDEALKGLAKALHCDELFLKEQLVYIEVFNWAIDPFSLGAYSYVTPKTEWAKKIIKSPVENTLFFGGEALGKNVATVEAALESADEIAAKLL
jgi:monoamine oxidase